LSSRRRHTRLQGDWSSDVCSSDLRSPSIAANGGQDVQQRDSSAPEMGGSHRASKARVALIGLAGAGLVVLGTAISVLAVGPVPRSEERRVGKEGSVSRAPWPSKLH